MLRVRLYRDNGRERVYIRQQPTVSRDVDRVARYSHRSQRNGAVLAARRADDVRLQTTM